ncbi:XdhC family protein [Pyruvatibacter sp.]|uniref:XdhC family protein n=1 Tax=Pyruvatibacter sp. TaxID=1981328 RepID=UPI00326647D3
MSSYTHSEDVFSFLTQAEKAGRKTALIAVTETVGGGLRAPGAVMGVDEDGGHAGYVSNGCVDADVILNAQQAIADRKTRLLTYGAGSPFLDIRLPCGGKLSMIVVPSPDPDTLRAALSNLEGRKAVSLTVSDAGVSMSKDMPEETHWADDALHLRIVPKLRLRIAGRGEELIALGKLAAAADFSVVIQSPDDVTLDRAAQSNLTFDRLTTAQSLPALADDEWTAFALMFHDQDWEIPLVQQTLEGPAFWLGAVGSHRTHQVRCEALRDAGVSKEGVRRLKGPIGLIPRTRDASMLAVSTLAEIAGCYKDLEA